MKTFLVAASLLLAASAATFAQAKPQLGYVEGTVTIDGASASVGDTVPFGAVVMTAASSQAEIEFNGRNAIRLSENTAFVFNPRNLQTGSELRKGGLALVLKGLSVGSQGQSFLVRTPSAVAGVRGTSFFVQVESPTSTYVCACNGAVQVLDPSGAASRELAASHHQGVRISSGSTGPLMTDAPMLYHTDSDIEKVAGDIGVSIDWTKVDR